MVVYPDIDQMGLSSAEDDGDLMVDDGFSDWPCVVMEERERIVIGGGKNGSLVWVLICLLNGMGGRKRLARESGHGAE
jgi:hypothetical protein